MSYYTVVVYHFIMFRINNSPVTEVLSPIISEMKDKTPTEVYNFIISQYDEDWFYTKTSSLKGNDNRLSHRIRSIRNKMRITN